MRSIFISARFGNRLLIVSIVGAFLSLALMLNTPLLLGFFILDIIMLRLTRHQINS